MVCQQLAVAFSSKGQDDYAHHGKDARRASFLEEVLAKPGDVVISFTFQFFSA